MIAVQAVRLPAVLGERLTDGLWQSRRQSEAFSRDGGKTYHVNGEPDTIRTTQRSKK